MRSILLVLLIASNAHAWPRFVDNFYGLPLDGATFNAPTDQYVPVYQAASRKFTLSTVPGSTPPDASTTVKGVAKLSSAPALATNPIAVGTNDVRMLPTPTGINKIPVDVSTSYTETAAGTLDQLLAINHAGNTVQFVTVGGDATFNGTTGALTLASTISAGGPIGDSTHVPQITFDAKGRLTAVSSVAITAGTWIGKVGGVNVDTAVGTLNFDGTRFSGTSSPAGTFNIDIATGGIGSTQIADGSIANIDISNTAAIAYSKLNLATSIVVGDLAAALSARILPTAGAAANTFRLVYDTNSAYSATASSSAAYQVPFVNSGQTAVAFALLDNNNIAAAAGIAYSKLTLTSSIVVGDLASALSNRINSATVTNGGLSYANGTNYSTSAGGTSGQIPVLVSNVPTWSDPAPSSFSGGYLSRSGSNLIFLPATSNKCYLKKNGIWVAKTIPTAGVTCSASTNNITNTIGYAYIDDAAGTGTIDTLKITNTATTTSENVSITNTGNFLVVAVVAGNSSDTVTTYNEDASTQLICNLYNKRYITLKKTESTSSWTSTTTSYMNANNSSTNRIQVVLDGNSGVSVQVMGAATHSGFNYATVGIGLDASGSSGVTNGATTSGSTAGTTGTVQYVVAATYTGVQGAGYHYYQWLQYTSASTATFYSATGFGPNAASGILLEGMF